MWDLKSLMSSKWTYRCKYSLSLSLHTILLVQTLGRGGGKGGPHGSDCEGFPLAPSRLAARGSRLATRLASPLVSRLASRVSPPLASPVAAAVVVTVAVAVPVICATMRFPEIYTGTAHPSPRLAGWQDPDCRPLPTHIMLTRSIRGFYTSMFSRAIPAILCCPDIFLAHSTISLNSIPSVHFPVSLTTYPG